MKKRQNFLPYALPSLSERELTLVTDTLKSLWWSRGARCEEFETRFREFVNAEYAVSVNSCTSALHLALACCDVGAEDEVITSPMTFCSTANVIVHQGATPVFCDIDSETGLIDADKIEELITPKTKVILPVHYGGQSCDLDKINAIGKRYNLKVVDDAAHATAAKYKGKMIGSLCDATAFSFYATKNLATGEGGMLTTNNATIYEKARILSLHGMDKNAFNRYQAGGTHEYDITYAGYKYNMSDLSAALGVAQIEQIEYIQNTRRKYADIYRNCIDKIEGISCLKQEDYCENAWHLFVITLDPAKISIDRNTFIEKLTAYNIGTSVHFKPVHTFTFYQEHFTAVHLPKAEDFYQNIISLPLYPSMTEEDVYYVMESVQAIAARYAK